MSPHQPAWAPSWKALWRTWVLVLAGLLAALATLAVQRGQQAALQQYQAEQTVALQDMGRSMSAGLEHALQLGIPLGEVAGLEPWLAEQQRISPLVSGLAVTLASGELLAQHGLSAEAAQQLRRPHTEQPPAPDQPPWVQVPVAAQPGQAPVAWLHVVGSPHPGDGAQVWATAALAAALAAVGAAALWLWARARVGWPVQRVQQQLAQLEALGTPGPAPSPVRGGPTPGTDPLARLDQALHGQLQRLRARQEGLLQKLEEVRAAHFDPRVLERIDALAQDLASALAAWSSASPTSPEVSGGPVDHRARGTGGLPRQLAWLGVAAASLVSAGVVWLHTQHLHTQAAAHARWAEQRLQAAVDLTLAQTLAQVAQQPRHPISARAAANPLATAQVPVEGLWTDPQLGPVVGVAQRDEGGAVWAATQPLAQALAPLAPRLQAPVALADHRGQPLQADGAPLVAAWQQAQRLPEADPAGHWRVAVPLLAVSGHTLGHAVALLPPEGLAPAPAWWLAAALVAVWALAGVGLWWGHRQLQPFVRAARELAQVAEVPERTSAHTLRHRDLTHDIALVAQRLDALRAIRRSRERQGRRQARFIRHQMLQLAQRLDEKARADVLQDLERIESASLQAPAQPVAPPAPSTAAVADPRFERMVDEVGVLALGFQNLVGRVGDQYQQLGQLVQELREALRVKTQFIAIQQELEIARKMQLAILPHDFSGQVGVQLHGFTQPAREVGGDFYDFFRLDDRHLAVVVADVSGKGIPAAFFMAVSRTLLRAIAQFAQGPADCVGRLNRLLAADNEEMMFVTLFYAVIDTHTGHTRYCSAGHNPPYVVRHTGTTEPLPVRSNMAVAVVDDLAFTEQHLQLDPGDTLLLYTDGVTEATNPEQAWFGEARLEAWLAQAAAQQPAPTVAELNQQLLALVRAFENGGAQSDDITCLTVRRLATGGQP